MTSLLADDILERLDGFAFVKGTSFSDLAKKRRKGLLLHILIIGATSFSEILKFAKISTHY